MAININWINDEVPDTIKVYKSEEKFTIQTLPSPYKTFTGDITQLIDKDVVRNKLYYYLVEKTKDDLKSYTPLISRAYFPDSGPGSTELVRGDWEAGFFGEVDDAEFFTPVQLILAVNGALKDGGFHSPNLGSAGWQKFIYNGKMIFIPLNGITTTGFNTLSWDWLYKKGLVYGVNGPTYHPESEEVPQTVRVFHEGLPYRVRLMRLTELQQGLQHEEDIYVTANSDELKGGEAGSTHYRQFFRLAADWIKGRIDNKDYINAYRMLFMELSSDDKVTIDTVTATSEVQFDSANYDQNLAFVWIPVLELEIIPT